MTAVFDMVVAADRARGIARRGAVPWRLPGDMAHFKALTSTTDTPGRRNAVIMGRKTWETIPAAFRPLPGRYNIVLTRDASLALPDGVDVASSFDQALRLAGRAVDVERIFVIGGSSVYAEALMHAGCRNIYYTRIDRDFDCDQVFPAFEDRFQLDAVMREAHERGIDYRIEVWRNPAGPDA